MNRNYFLWIVGLALASLGLIFGLLLKEINSPLTESRVRTAPVAYASYIAGVGVVEASSGNVMIKAGPNRRVEKIFVKDGQKVKKDDPLFALNNLDLRDKLRLEEIAYRLAIAKLERMKSLPRPEDITAAESELESAQIELESAKTQYEMVGQLSDPRLVSQEEKNRRLSSLKQAQAKWEKVKADLDKVKAGAWKPDLEIAQIEVQEAKANIDRTKGLIDRSIVKSPLNATVLQININEGEYPSSRVPALIVGETSPLFVRVSINQLDIPRFNKELPATAYLQGDLKKAYPLEFIRIEPLLVDKSNLTNDILEKVDTKVLHILYLVKEKADSLIVGQQMDVFIATKDEETAKL